MGNDVLNFTASEIFKDDYITIEIPLTGKNMPIVFKGFVAECVTQDIRRNILDDDADLLTELLENGLVNTTLKTGQISLLLKIDADGKFSENMTLIYTYYENNRKATIFRDIKYFELTYSYNDLYRKKALRVLKRRITKGLKQLAKISDK
jgi:hypothetical protein